MLISPAPLCRRSVYELIAGVIDFEDNADDGGDPDQAGVMVQHGVSDELDQMKHLYDGKRTLRVHWRSCCVRCKRTRADAGRPLLAGLPDFLTKVAKVEMQRIPPDLAYAAGAAGEGGEGGGGVLLSVSYIPKVGHAVRMQGPGTRPLCPALEAALPDYSFGFEGETDAGYGAFYFCERTRQARLPRCGVSRARLALSSGARAAG